MTGNMLSDKIEQFILREMRRRKEDAVILRRKELAHELDCAPSQITYVLNTRFSLARGFQVESRRGNGGYIRITLAPQAEARRAVSEPSGGMEEMEQYFSMLARYEAITPREWSLIEEMIHMLFELCPKDHRKEAAEEMVQRIEHILKGGHHHAL